MKTCSICSEKHEGLGYCRKHYRSFKKHGSPYFSKRKTTKGMSHKLKEINLKCKLCDRDCKSLGYCDMHYRRYLKYGNASIEIPAGGKPNTIKRMLEIIAQISCDSNGCKIWPMGINSAGYGHYSIKNKSYNVARLLYKTIFPGDYKGKVIRHSCDVRSCCNIDHLEHGTQKDNIHDIIKRNRGLFGKKTN